MSGFGHPACSVPPPMSSPHRQRSRSSSPVRVETSMHPTHHSIYPPHHTHANAFLGGHSRLIPSPTPSQKSEEQKIDVTGEFKAKGKMFLNSFLRQKQNYIFCAHISSL